MPNDNRIQVLYLANGRKYAGDLPVYLDVKAQINEAAVGLSSHPLDWELVTNQKTALRLARSRPARMILVEVKASGNRLRFCEMLRYRLPSVKLVAVGNQPSGDNSLFDGLLRLPFQSDEVKKILNMLLDGSQDHLLQNGPLGLNLETRTVVTSKGQYHMTPKQCALLHMLMTRHDQVVLRREIMQTIWETNYMEDTRTLDVHIRWLRERIEPDPSSPTYLVTIRGKGYRLHLK